MQFDSNDKINNNKKALIVTTTVTGSTAVTIPIPAPTSQSPTPMSMSQPVTPKSVPTTPTGLFKFKWFIQNKAKSKWKKKSLCRKNEKNSNNAGAHTQQKASPKKKVQLSRQCYSFDDVQQFINENNKIQNIQSENKKLNASEEYKSSFDVAKDPINICRKKVKLFCKLCLMSKSNYEMHSIWSCGCAFCKQCLSKYCETLILDGKIDSINCPDGSCKNQMKNNFFPKEIKLLVSRELFENYEKFRLNWLVERDPNKLWCPTPNCETICYTNSSKTSKSPVAVVCSKCNNTFCSSCRRNCHFGVDCKDFNLKSEEFSELSHIKRCPKCCILIERDEGCAQMMCRNCKHVFCWFCLASLEDDFLLRHYDKGPCKNKLGHSRASVIWHRTQVVGIFAGFGLLLLLASPMFLLAAPCLLCCKCNTLCKYDDPDDDDQDDDEDQRSIDGIFKLMENSSDSYSII